MSWLSELRKWWCETGGEVSSVPDDWRCEEVPMMTGFLNVSQSGEVSPFSCPNGATIEKTGTGTYEVVAPPGSLTHSIHAIVDEDSRDGVHIHFDGSFTQGGIWIGIGDNGQAADTLIDAPFTVQWFGKRTIVVCDTVDPEGRLP